MAPKSAPTSARNGSQKPKPKKEQLVSSFSAEAGESERTPVTYAPGVRPDRRLYEEEQGKFKTEIDALQVKLV